MRVRAYPLGEILMLVFCLPLALLAAPKGASHARSGLVFMEVRLAAPVKFSRLKPGDTLDGKVAQDVFSGYRLVVPAGSAVHLTVSNIKRGRRKHSNLWPWPVRYFLPKYQHIPSFDFAQVSLPDGRSTRLRVETLSALDSVHVAVKRKAGKKRSKKSTPAVQTARHAQADQHPLGPRLQLVLNPIGPEEGSSSPDMAASSAAPRAHCSGIRTLTAGSQVELALLGPLSASKSRSGQPIKALLMQPLRLNSSQILPEGTVFEGRVTKSVPPRWLSRPGSLYVKFTRLVLPAAGSRPIAASVAGVDVGRRSRIHVSSEGGLSGGAPSKVELLKELGVGMGAAKVADDSYQLIAEAFIATATDASTAGTARLLGFAFSGLYVLTRHGHDVTLPPYTTITIRFDRFPSSLSPENNLPSTSSQ